MMLRTVLSARPRGALLPELQQDRGAYLSDEQITGRPALAGSGVDRDGQNSTSDVLSVVASSGCPYERRLLVPDPKLEVLIDRQGLWWRRRCAGRLRGRTKLVYAVALGEVVQVAIRGESTGTDLCRD